MKFKELAVPSWVIITMCSAFLIYAMNLEKKIF